MKTYIKQQKTLFRIIRNSDGTITTECLIVAQLNIEKLQRRFPFLNIRELCSKMPPRCSLITTHRSKTTCSPKDAYDEARGQHIAESRAKTKMYQYYADLLTKIQDKVCQMIEDISPIIHKNQECLAHEWLHSKDLTK